MEITVQKTLLTQAQRICSHSDEFQVQLELRKSQSCLEVAVSKKHNFIEEIEKVKCYLKSKVRTY